MKVSEFIWTIDNALPGRTIHGFYNWAKSLNNGNPGTVGKENALDHNIRKVECFALDRTSKSLANVHWSNYLISVITQKLLKKYVKDTKAFYCEPTQVTAMEILKYSDNGFYKPHVDHFHMCPRTLTCLLMMNDDYEGGELFFTNPDGTEEIVISNKQNRAIIFPSNFLYPHAVKPVTKGVRYSLVCWIL